MYVNDNSTALLERIKCNFLNSDGLKRKQSLKQVAAYFEEVSGSRPGHPVLGDDAAVISFGEKKLLLAADGINIDSVDDLYWAGYCAVLVNVNDIYAMGGQPLALVNIIGGSENDLKEIMAGLRDGCKKFRVQMVGGHLHPGSKNKEVSVAVLGAVDRVLSSFGACAGDDLIIAVDLLGKQYKSYPHWDSTSFKSSKEVLERLQTVKLLAQKGVINAAKDISNPGILGTIGMLLETSGVGAVVGLSDIPVPEGIELQKWLSFFPGFGFVFSVNPRNSQIVYNAFKEAGVAAGKIGHITENPKLEICLGDNSCLELINFTQSFITGMSKQL